MVDLVTGRSTSNSKNSKLTKMTGNVRDTNMPILIRDSIKSMKPCPFNPTYVFKWLHRLDRKHRREKNNYRRALSKYEKGSPEFNVAQREYLRAQGKKLNDFGAIETILNQNPKIISVTSKNGDPLFEYKTAYSVQSSGRISEINGGFQSASKYLKRSLLRDMPKMKINYDLKGSQANILLQEFEACNLKSPWLESYLSNPDAKDKYAGKVGIPVDVWKDCFYALIMGAEAKSMFGAVFKAFKYHFDGDWGKAKKAHKLFLKIAKELIEVTEKWRNYIYETNDRRYHYQHDGKKHWRNACGMRFKAFGLIKDGAGRNILIDCLNDNKPLPHKRNIDKCKRKLAAFILQGQEACFIHHLTIICSKNDIPVYKNEHDGIIVGKKIPDELVKMAAEKSGLNNPILIKKPLCAKKERIELLEYVKN
jgi:hypothetical protein